MFIKLSLNALDRLFLVEQGSRLESGTALVSGEDSLVNHFRDVLPRT
jgi:hypothetical protein